MARENQGLKIALIIFVSLTLVLGLTTFLAFKQSGEKATAAAKYQEDANTAKDTAGIIQENFNTLKGYAGHPDTAKIESIGEDYGKDIERCAAVVSIADDKRNYRDALLFLLNEIQARNASLASELAANEDLKKQIEDLESIKAPLVAQAEQRAAAAVAERDKLRSDFNDARNSVTDQQKKQLASHLQMQKDFDAQLEGLQTQYDSQLARVADLQQLLDEKNKTIIEIIEPTFEMADGKIRWVNQRNQTVWINLGRADALQRLTSFSVYPADTNDVTKVGKKASIEVTQILGDHLAEARIVEDEYGDPVMPGDVIHTPVWAPGEKEHFALTDGMDLDGDGRTDLAMVRNIITMNGGVVDCSVTDEGQRVGDFTNATRYLVMGSAPDETATDARRDARTQFLKDAEERGLMKITLKDLLDKMGWKNQAPVVRVGRGASPNDLRAQPPEGGPRTSTGTVSPLFQPRNPPRRSSAY